MSNDHPTPGQSGRREHQPVYRWPAWVSAAAALLISGIALWSLAAAPSDTTLREHRRWLDDLEVRTRTLENLTARELAAINAQLRSMQQSLYALSIGRPVEPPDQPPQHRRQERPAPSN